LAVIVGSDSVGSLIFDGIKFLGEPQMESEAAQLVRQAVGAGRRAYVLVNNRAEGNAPLTVEGLVRMLQG
jgi:hypothetical protein